MPLLARLLSHPGQAAMCEPLLIQLDTDQDEQFVASPLFLFLFLAACPISFSSPVGTCNRLVVCVLLTGFKLIPPVFILISNDFNLIWRRKLVGMATFNSLFTKRKMPIR